MDKIYFIIIEDFRNGEELEIESYWKRVDIWKLFWVYFLFFFNGFLFEDRFRFVK